MKFRKRLNALERRLVCEPATLFFEDGTSAQLRGRGDYVLNLFAAAAQGKTSHDTDLIARSVRSEEPGGAHIARPGTCSFEWTYREPRPMKVMERRLSKLEERFGPEIETIQTRRLRERLAAAVDAWAPYSESRNLQHIAIHASASSHDCTPAGAAH